MTTTLKINRFITVVTIIIGLLIALLSGGFFLAERNLILRTIAEVVNQNLFYIEGELRSKLESESLSEVQSILDQAVAVNPSLSAISLSFDGASIARSSSRAWKGQSLHKRYLPINEMAEGIKKGHVDYQDRIYYYDNGAARRSVLLLINMDKTYVYHRMNTIAILYGIGFFLVLSLVTVLVYFFARKLISLPLERITEHARAGNAAPADYFIEEFTELDQTLCTTFSALQEQRHALQKSLAHSTYLDEVLRTVADINQLLITSNSTNELMDKSAARLARHPGYAMCIISRVEQSRLVVHACSLKDRNLCQGHVMADVDRDGDQNPFVKAFRQRHPVVVERLLSEELHSRFGGESWPERVRQGDYGSLVVLPLLPSIHSEPIGVLGVFAQHAMVFDRQEIAMLQELAGDIGFAIRAFEHRAQLQHHLTTDPNTGLPNRAALVDRLESVTSGVIALVDIDRFSDINAVYGIAIGDALLRQYGTWLNAYIEGHDDVTVYKLTGDEFALHFIDAHTYDELAPFFAELITRTANTTFEINTVEIVLSITVGMALAVDRGLTHAAAAVKQAKLKHQSLGQFDGVDLTRQQENNIAWYRRIKEAIETSRIVPYFQPIVDSKTQTITKYEALIRLQDVDGQVIGPYQFLNIAKKTKLYSLLTRMMIDKVLAVFQESDIPVSINLSTEDLLNTELADYIDQRLTETGMGRQIVFEILESEGVNNYESVRAFMQRFKAKGCMFAIDDFGSGYSNFDHLTKLNVDLLKIDGSLIKTLPHDRNSQIIVRHICDFAHEMNMRTVAEFVANEAIYQQICVIGIDDAQGFYFYEPQARPFGLTGDQ